GLTFGISGGAQRRPLHAVVGRLNFWESFRRFELTQDQLHIDGECRETVSLRHICCRSTSPRRKQANESQIAKGRVARERGLHVSGASVLRFGRGTKAISCRLGRCPNS